MATQKKQKTSFDEQRVLAPEFRASYPHLFKPSAMKGTTQDPKYSITMLFPKNGDLGPIKAAIKAAKTAAFGPKENWPDDLESPVTDGDDPKHADKEGYKGHYAIKASTSIDQKPGLVDENVEDIIDQSKFYAGCYARAYIFCRVWEFGGRQGIHFMLDHVQKTRDGKSFGGKKDVKSIFTKIETEDSSADMNNDDNGDEDEASGFM